MLTIVITASAILIGLFVMLTFLLFVAAFVKVPMSRDITKDGELDKPKFARYKERMLNGIKSINERESESVCVKSYDGLKLCGRLYKNPAERGVLLLCHGYRSISENDYTCMFDDMYDEGFTILLIDMRAHGRSGGHIITFGIRERHDIHTWAEYLCDRFPKRKIIISGISMGAASVLMSSGEPFPDNVAGLILDCGYTSPKDALISVIKRIHLPTIPVYPMVRLGARIFGGFDPESCTAIDEGRKSRLPALFIHGERDRLVPYSMGKANFNAYAGKKKLISVQNAGHGMSYIADTERVRGEIRGFVSTECISDSGQ